MHLHLVRVVARPKAPRPAKVIVLEARRKARLEAARTERRPPRPAACDDEPHAPASRACGSSCGCGGTGIRTGLRSRRPSAMRVRLPPSAPRPASVAQLEEHRASNPGAEVRPLSEAFATPWPSGEA